MMISNISNMRPIFAPCARKSRKATSKVIAFPSLYRTVAHRIRSSTPIHQLKERSLSCTTSLLSNLIAQTVKLSTICAMAFRKASLTTQFFANALEKNNHEYGSWICGFIMFKDDVNEEQLKQHIVGKLLDIPRFRSRYDSKRGGFVELDEEEMDTDYHFRIVEDELSLNEISDAYVGDIYGNMGFDVEKPWWQVLFFPRMRDGRSLLLTRIAHVIGDGISQVELLFRLMDKPEGEGATSGALAIKPPKKRKVVKSSYGPLNKALVFMRGVFTPFYDVFSKPDSRNPLSRLDPNSVGKKNTAFSELISLERVKEVKAKFEGATINDILMALLTLTMSACFKENEKETGEQTPQNVKIRAGFAIDTRGQSRGPFRDGSPYNAAVQGTYRFEMDYTSRVDLVWKIKAQVDRIKLSPGPMVMSSMIRILGTTLPKRVSTNLFTGALGNITALLSNVPGPQGPVSVCGTQVDDLQFLLSTPRSCYFGILSYNGKVSCGVSFDETTKVKPKDFSRNWAIEFEELYKDAMAIDGIMKQPRAFWQVV